jgi:hypothetical protein
MPDVRRTQGSFVQCLTIALVTIVTCRSCSMERAALTWPGGMPSNMSPPASCTNMHHHQPSRSATLLQTSSDTLEQELKKQCMHGMLYDYCLNLTGHIFFGRLEAMSTREDKHQTCNTLLAVMTAATGMLQDSDLHMQHAMHLDYTQMMNCRLHSWYNLHQQDAQLLGRCST